MRKTLMVVSILIAAALAVGIAAISPMGGVNFARATGGSYLAKFYEEDGLSLKTQCSVNYGESTSKMSASGKEGYEFVGWAFTKNGSESVVKDFSSFVFCEESLGNDYEIGDTIVFVEKYVPKEFDLSFVIPAFSRNVNGEKTVFSASKNTQTIHYGETVEPEKIKAPSIEHYEFEGWYCDKDYTSKATSFVVTKATALFGKYEPKDALVTFVYGEKSNIKCDVFVTIGDLPEPIEVPNTESKKFDHWDKSMGPAKDGDSYTAIYTNLYSYSYYAEGVLIGTYTSEPSKAPSATKKYGYEFSYYSTSSENGYDFIFEAVYVPKIYEIEIDAPEYVEVVKSSIGYYESEITITINMPSGTTITSFTMDGTSVINKMVGNSFTFIMPADDVKFIITATNNTILDAQTGKTYISNHIPDTSNEEKKLSGGEIAAIVVAAIIFAVAMVTLIMYLIGKYRLIKLYRPKQFDWHKE